MDISQKDIKITTTKSYTTIKTYIFTLMFGFKFSILKSFTVREWNVFVWSVN